MGMRPIVVDSGEAKKDLSMKMGAEEFVDFKEHKDTVARVKEVADGIGAHGVLVTAYQSYKGTLSLSTVRGTSTDFDLQTRSTSSATASAAESCALPCHLPAR